jgi:hypothetical protein
MFESRLQISASNDTKQRSFIDTVLLGEFCNKPKPLLTMLSAEKKLRLKKYYANA